LIYPGKISMEEIGDAGIQTNSRLKKIAYKTVIPIADRKWQVEFEPLDSFYDKRRALFPYFVCAGLALITFLLTVYIVSIIRRNQIVDAKVLTQTAEIRRNKQLLEDLINNSTTAIYIKNLSGQYVMVNRFFGDIFKVNTNRSTPLTDYDIFEKYRADEVRKNDLDVIKQKRVIRVEEIVPQGDGEHTYMSIKFPLFNEKQEVYATCGLSTDITDEKRVQEALKNSEKRLNLAIEAGNIGLWDWVDVYKDEVWWSERFHELLGYKQGEIKTGLSFFKEIIHSDDYTKTFQLLDDHFKNGVPFNIKFLLKTKKGEYRWFQSQGETIRDKDGNPRRMLGTILDIHERKQKETQLQKMAEDLTQKNQELQIERQRFILASQSAGQGVWDWDIKNNTLVWDDKMYELYGVKKSDFTQIYESWQKALLPEDREFAESQLQAAVRGEKEFRPYFRILRPDGQVRVIKADAIVLRDEKGDAVRVIGINSDVTDQKELEGKLIQTNQELEQFAYIASHDLQEPLRKVIAFGNLLKEKASTLDEESKDYIDRMKRSSERMQRLIEDLLTYSRLGRGNQELKPVNMNEVLSDVLLDLEVTIKKKSAKIERDEFPTVLANELQIQQLFQNLLSNSLKYSKKDVPPHIFVKNKILDDNAVEITVVDNGIGFDEKYADRIFVPFQRLHHRNEYEGTGVGLAICKKIVELNKGTIKVKSKEGEGSTFIIQLPMQRGDAAK
jgi:PAS domain S-box-containing protein